MIREINENAQQQIIHEPPPERQADAPATPQVEIQEPQENNQPIKIPQQAELIARQPAPRELTPPPQPRFRPMDFVPLEEGEITSEEETNEEPSILEVPAIKWAKCAGCKNVQYIQLGHEPKTAPRNVEEYNSARTVCDAESGSLRTSSC